MSKPDKHVKDVSVGVELRRSIERETIGRASSPKEDNGEEEGIPPPEK